MQAIISLKLLVWIYQTSNLNFPLKSIRLATTNWPQSGYDSDMFLDSTIYNLSNFDVSRYLEASVGSLGCFWFNLKIELKIECSRRILIGDNFSKVPGCYVEGSRIIYWEINECVHPLFILFCDKYTDRMRSKCNQIILNNNITMLLHQILHNYQQWEN